MFYYFLQGLDDVKMKATAIDIFSFIVEFSPSMVREFILRECQNQDDVSYQEMQFFFLQT